jgi:hypothetical protein
MKAVVAVLCGALSACHPGTGRDALTNRTAASDEGKPAVVTALIDRNRQLTRACNGGDHAACNAAGQTASELEIRGYCQPDGDERWRKEPVCAQINGPADLKLGNVETPVS